VFEDVRQAFRELLNGNVPPEARRAALSDMRATLVRAKMALDDLREGIAVTRKRLVVERGELETIRRRRVLAEGIGDKETVDVATRFEAHQSERVALFEKKLEVQEGELALVEGEVEEMTAQYKAANAGVGWGMAAGSAPSTADVGDDGSGRASGDPGLDQELDTLDRARRRSASEAEADARLAELKRRMGR
jgi:hypothetical protein